MTRSNQILIILKECGSNGITCWNMYKKIVERFGYIKSKDQSMIFSYLNQVLWHMIENDKVELHPTKKGPQGGKIYRLKSI